MFRTPILGIAQIATSHEEGFIIPDATGSDAQGAAVKRSVATAIRRVVKHEKR